VTLLKERVIRFCGKMALMRLYSHIAGGPCLHGRARQTIAVRIDQNQDQDRVTCKKDLKMLRSNVISQLTSSCQESKIHKESLPA